MITYVFDLATQATPQRVWEALTDSELTTGYLWCLAARSTWNAGSEVTFDGIRPFPMAVRSEIPAAAASTRLSYSLGARGDQTTSYVTWEVRTEGEGSVVRLSVDEPMN